MTSALVPAVGDLARHVWVAINRLSDHERAHLDLVAVEQLEQARNALQIAVLEVGFGGQIRYVQRHRDGKQRPKGA